MSKRAKKIEANTTAERIVEDVLRCVEKYGLSLKRGKLELGHGLTDTALIPAMKIMEARVSAMLVPITKPVPKPKRKARA